MKDIDRMPVICCGSAMHHEVARGILPAADLEEYKLKYDERMNTVDPLYCPVPTCSTFIPPRMFNSNDTRVTCHVCNTVVCTKCKQHAEDEHTCTKEDPRKFILEAFHYKLCPKCGTGVMKMYGCPHVRCQCGAHWCWDCQRPMNACYQKPCRAARDEGNYSEAGDEDFESDDEIAGNEGSTAALVPTNEASSALTAPTETAISIQAEVVQGIEVAISSLREDPVVMIDSNQLDEDGTYGRADTGNLSCNTNITPATTTGASPSVPPAPLTELATNETTACESTETGINGQTQPLARSYPDMTAAELGALIVGSAEASAGQAGNRVLTETPNAGNNEDTVQNASADGPASATSSTQPAAHEPMATDCPTSGSTGPRLVVADAPVTDAAATEQTADRVDNLDDPEEFDWEGRDLDFGDEPTDESWDTWGCQHHFDEFGKERVPEFWLVGVNPKIDPSLEVECMGCFKKARVWENKTRDEYMKEKWAQFKASGSERQLKKLATKSQISYECRLCGVIYCGACKKAARKRILRERMVTDTD